MLEGNFLKIRFELKPKEKVQKERNLGEEGRVPDQDDDHAVPEKDILISWIDSTWNWGVLARSDRRHSRGACKRDS